MRRESSEQRRLLRQVGQGAERPNANFPTVQGPVQLTDPGSSYEGGMIPGITRSMMLAQINSRDVQIQVYFGSDNPSADMKAAAQSALDRLVVTPSVVETGAVCAPGEQPMTMQPLTVAGYDTVEAAVRAALSWVGVTTTIAHVQQGMSVSGPDASGEIHVTINRIPIDAARSDHVYLTQGSDGSYFVETLVECQASHSP